MTMKTTGNEKETTMASHFRKQLFGKPVYVCANCKHNTRNTSQDAARLDLCELCYDEAGIENAHSDGHHNDEKDMTCHQCNPAIKTVIQQRAEELKGQAAISAAPTTPHGKENTMANKTTGHAATAKAEIAKLIKKLVSLKDKSDAEGRKIRRMLRKLGHQGGTRATSPKAKAAPKKPAKKAPKAKAQKLVGQGGSDAQGVYRGD